MAVRLCLAALVCLLLAGTGWPEGRPRARSGMRPNRREAALVDPRVWDPEPPSPSPVDPHELARALREVCGPMPTERAERYAARMIESGTRHGEDPFLLAALAYRFSRCLPEARPVEGIGLTGLPLTMYRENVRGRTLRYLVLENGQAVERSRQLGTGYLEQTLALADENLEWAAALLAMWREQHEFVHLRFQQVPHRHHVSHFIWGDRVPSARAEDRLFTDRRRLLAHYGATVPSHTRSFRGLDWGAPLEAAPRVVSSQPGEEREGGLRVHRGVDIEAVLGEPVLAMADGVVAFAGVDLPGLANNASMSPARIARVPRKKLGRGGRYVCVTHLENHGDEAWLRSCSMHLEEVRVHTGQRVQRGQVLGTVGRTGMARSAPHLHLEIKSDKRLYDARHVLTDLLVGEPPDDAPRKKRRRARR